MLKLDIPTSIQRGMTTEISKALILEKIEEKNQELALTLNNALKVSLAG